MAALDFLRRRHDVHAIHFNHGTAHAQKAEEFVKIQCAKYNVPLMIGRMKILMLIFRRRVRARKNGGVNAVIISLTNFLLCQL